MADRRHKRDANARPPAPTRGDGPKTTLGRTLADTFGNTLGASRRAALVAAPLATVTTLGLVGVGVLADSPATADLVADRAASSLSGAAPSVERAPVVSRDSSRAEQAAELRREKKAKEQRAEERRATATAIKQADTWRWATTDLNLWPSSTEQENQLGLLEAGTKVLITGRFAHERTEIVRDGKARWVTSGYFADEKPEVTPGIGGACTNGTSVSSGVSGNIVAVHRAVCAAFPEITAYGTLRGGGGDHPLGRAVDIMVSGSRGWQVAEFVRAHYRELGVSYVIYSQRIWSVERVGEGWRPMSNRGSATANHYDHVHVSTF